MKENNKFVKQFKQYIKKSIRGEYFNYLKKINKYDEVHLEKVLNESNLCIPNPQNDNDIIDIIADNNLDNFEKLFESLLEKIDDYNLISILNSLTLSQKKIIYYIYELNWKEKDISNYFNISIQAVNKLKHKALKKIKKEIRNKELNYA